MRSASAMRHAKCGTCTRLARLDVWHCPVYLENYVGFPSPSFLLVKPVPGPCDECYLNNPGTLPGPCDESGEPLENQPEKRGMIQRTLEVLAETRIAHHSRM